MPSDNKKFPVVLFMDPRGVILNGGYDVIQRIQSYASALVKNSKNEKIKIVILSSSSRKKFDIFSGPLLIVNSICKPTFNSIKFAIKSRNYLRQQDWDIKLLVGGDPWESLWATIFLNYLQKSRIPVQVQVHGDFANPNWKRINFRNLIRFYTLSHSLEKADSIRTVNIKQTRQIKDLFHLSYKKFVIAPVPILAVDKIPQVGSDRPNSIALIGRIHEDRGIWDFLDLIKSLSSIRDDFKVIIIGSGPRKKKFLARISTFIPVNRFQHIEFLDQIQFRKLWSQIGVLVSIAPTESYGRTMREALVAGVPVWATKSSGVDDLISKAGKDAVKILNLNKRNYELSLELDQLLKVKVPIGFRKRFIKDNSTYAQIVAKSWVHLIRNQK